MDVVQVDEPTVEVTVTDNSVEVNVCENIVEVIVTERGPQGIQGVPGTGGGTDLTAIEPLKIIGEQISLWYDEDTLALGPDGLTVVGGGTGGNADTLDGHDSTYFIDTSSGAQTKAGDLQVSGKVTTNTLDLDEVSHTASTTHITNTSVFTLDTFDVNQYRSVEYVLQMSQASNFLTTRVILIHDSANAAITEYATISLGADIDYDLSVLFSGTNISLQITCYGIGSDPIDVIASRILFDR